MGNSNGRGKAGSCFLFETEWHLQLVNNYYIYIRIHRPCAIFAYKSQNLYVQRVFSQNHRKPIGTCVLSLCVLYSLEVCLLKSNIKVHGQGSTHALYHFSAGNFVGRNVCDHAPTHEIYIVPNALCKFPHCNLYLTSSVYTTFVSSSSSSPSVRSNCHVNKIK